MLMETLGRIWNEKIHENTFNSVCQNFENKVGKWFVVKKARFDEQGKIDS